MQTGLVNIANMHPEWGTSFNLTSTDMSTFWFTNASYSRGNLAVNYSLVGLGISGITYNASSRLDVQVMDTVSNQAYLNVTIDKNSPLINLGKQNFEFYRYENSSSTWSLVNPSTEPIGNPNGTYQIDIPSGIDPDSCVILVQDQRGIKVVASSFSRYSSTLTWNLPPMAKYAVSATDPAITGASDGNYATVARGATCNATDYQGGTEPLNQVYFNITYYGSDSGTIGWYYQLDGGAWNKIEDLPEGGSAASPLTRTYNATSLRASWTWDRLNATHISFLNNFNNQNASVDAIYATVVVGIGGNDTTVIELLQNGTMRWFGQNLQLTAQEKPIPPMPVKSIHVNQTINGANSEVPFQVEDWASEYRIPQGLTNNASVFSSRNMLVFLVTPKVSKVTIWWNGSDAATQTSYAYVNRYFTGDNTATGTLTNGILTLKFGNEFTVTSTTGSSSCTANFMRINNNNSTYGSGLAYVITKGIVRDIIHQEAEWSNGVDNCPNLYAHIVLTLPANATYYTYQLRLMFVQSQQNRSITDLCPIELSALSGQTQTENGTLNGFPIVSNATSLFFNYSASVWAHHWSQFISGAKGAGIIFTDADNQKLYTFDTIAGSKTGALLVNSTKKTVELLPVTMARTNFTYALDVIWDGAVVTFDGTTPIYKEQSSSKTGLWIAVEYPPTIAVTTEN